MKKKEMAICKYDRCQREYDRNEVARSYGELSDVFLLGYCSPYCYIRDNVKEIVVVLEQKETDQ